VEESQRGGLDFGVLQQSQVLDQLIVIVLDKVIELTQLYFEFRRSQEEIHQIVSYAGYPGQLEVNKIGLGGFRGFSLIPKHNVVRPAISVVEGIEILWIGRVHGIHKIHYFWLNLVLQSQRN